MSIKSHACDDGVTCVSVGGPYGVGKSSSLW